MPFIPLTHATALGGSLYYEDQGQGQPVVLIHGWPLSGKSWEAQVGPLVEAGFRVITYDRRGFGASCRPWEGYDYDTLSHDLNDLLHALNLRKVTQVGFSMGGGEVARYVGTYGTERVAKAVFAAAVPPYLFKTDDNPQGAVTQQDLEDTQRGVQQDRQAFLEAFTQKFFTPKGGTLAVSEDQRLFAKQIASTASLKGTHDCVAAFSCTDFRTDLRKFAIPTLVLHGDGDQTVPLEVSGQRTHALIPGSQLHVIAGAPHGCNVSHAEEFNQVLIEFLKK